MTYILHLETSTKVCSVGISKNGELIAIQEIKEDRYSHGEQLTLLIEKCLVDAKLKMSSLSAVSIASGPGSYTGLRIGTATAKGICYALDIPLIAIDALTSLIEQAKIIHPNDNLCAVMDARRMEVYNKIVSSDGTISKEISADVIEEDSYTEFSPFIYFGDGATKLQDIWSKTVNKCDLNIYSSVKGQLSMAYHKFNNSDFEDLAYFEPFYLKDFIAGISKKKLV